MKYTLIVIAMIFSTQAFAGINHHESMKELMMKPKAPPMVIVKETFKKQKAVKKGDKIIIKDAK